MTAEVDCPETSRKTRVTQIYKTINPTLNKLLNEVYATKEAEDEGLLDAV